MIRARFFAPIVTVVVLAGCSFSSGSGSSEAVSKDSDTACFVGDWEGTDATMRTMLKVIGQRDADVWGAVVLTLSNDGGFAYAFDDLGTNRGANGTPIGRVLNGNISGTYSAASDALLFNVIDSSITFTIDGRKQQTDYEGTNNYGNGIAGESPYTCSGDRLTVTGSNDGKITTWTRI